MSDSIGSWYVASRGNMGELKQGIGRRGVELVQRLTGVLSTDVTPDELVQRLADEAATSMDVAIGAYVDNALEPVAPRLGTNGASSAAGAWLASVPPARRESLFDATFRQGKTVCWADVPLLGGAEEKALPSRSLLAAPVRLRGGEVHGCLFFAGPRAGAFSDHDERLAGFLAGLVGLAVENARGARMRESVLDVLAQELRTPLAAVINDVGLVLKALPPDAHLERQRLEDTARGGACTPSSELVDLAQLEAGTLSFDIKQHDPSSLLLEALEANRTALAAKGLAVMRSAPPRLSAACDRRRIVHVLSRLIERAVRVTPANGRVTLHVVADAGEIRLGVGDEGAQLPPALLERLLVGDTREHDRDGYPVGLSVAIARAIVSAHGGRFWGESLPSGVTFHFTLPVGA